MKPVKAVKPRKKVKGNCVIYRGVVYKVGDRVMLKSTAFTAHDKHPDKNTEVNIFTPRVAKIVGIMPDAPRLVRLNIKLGGYWTWTVDELIRIRRK